MSSNQSFMSSISDRILLLERALPQGSDLPAAVVGEITDILRDKDFANLSLQQQHAFLDFIQDAYHRTHHSSAPEVAAAVGDVFRTHLSAGEVPLHRLCKTYDLMYFLYWCAAVSIDQQRGFDAAAVLPFSQYLTRRFGPPSRFDGLRPEGPLRIGYLSQFAYEGQGNALALVADTLLASLREHHPHEYELFFYAWMHKTPEFVERIRALGITVRTFDLSRYSRQELSRMRTALIDDRLDVAITDMNSAVPHYLFDRGIARFQVFYQLGLPFWQVQNVDAMFQGWQIAPATLGWDRRKCYAVPAPKSTRNINPPVDHERVRAERSYFPPGKHTIGFYGRLVKITDRYLEILRSILQTNPETIAVLGGTGNAVPIVEFIKANGLEKRLFVRNEFVDGHIWGRFLDVFLDTFPLTGGYSCREVLAKGKPIVHMLSGDMPNLNSFLDPGLQATTAEEYVAHASQLLKDFSAYRRASRRSLEIARKDADLKPFATMFHSALQSLACGTLRMYSE